MLSRRAMMNDEIITEQGKNLVLQKCKGSYLHGMKVYGHTTQQTTTGAQLANIPNAAEVTINGVTLSVKNNTMYIKGTATARVSSTHDALNAAQHIIMEPGIYHISGYKNARCRWIVSIHTVDAETKWVQNGTFTITGNESDIIVYFQIDEGETVNDEIPVMLNAGDTALPWEPYTGGAPSPSPDYPQEIVSAGDKGSIEVEVLGKNLFRIQNVASNDYVINNGDGTLNITTIPSSSGVYAGGDTTLINYAPELKVGDIYTLSAKTTGREKRIYLDKAETVWYFGQSVELTEDMLQSRVVWYASGVSTTANISDIQIELGAEPTTYEPYRTPQTLTMFTPNGIPGIPVSSGGNYTDENGQQWIADYRDWERGVDVKRIYKYTFTGQEVGHDDFLPILIMDFPAEIPRGEAVIYTREALLVTHAPSNKVNFSNVSGMTIAFRNGDYFGAEDTSQLKAILREKYENGQPLEIMYILKEPIETPIPAEELAAYRALHTNTPTTTIANDEDCWMEVTHRRLRG